MYLIVDSKFVHLKEEDSLNNISSFPLCWFISHLTHDCSASELSPYLTDSVFVSGKVDYAL